MGVLKKAVMEHTIILKDVIKRDDQVVAGYETVTGGSFSLEGKTAVVTGGGRGIGRAIAIGLARFGADIAVVDVHRESAWETVGMIRDIGKRSQAYLADVSDYERTSAMMEEIYQEFSAIDILVNNAGVGSDSSFPEVSLEEWDRVIKINLGSVMNCSKAAARYMIRQEKGAIINMGSSLPSRAAIFNCLGGSPEYCVSKAGVQALTRSAAQFMAAKGIRVNAVAPGPVDSPMHASRREALAGELPRIPLGRIQNCEDMIGPVVFLASEAARFVTGQTIHVNGGMLMAD